MQVLHSKKEEEIYTNIKVIYDNSQTQLFSIIYLATVNDLISVLICNSKKKTKNQTFLTM